MNMKSPFLLSVSLLLLLSTTLFSAQKEKKTYESYKFYIMTSGITVSADQGGYFMTGFYTEKTGGDKLTAWGLNPEVGYMITDDFWAGIGIGFKQEKWSGPSFSSDVKTTYFGLNPYVCRTLFSHGIMSVFLCGDVLYGTAKTDGADRVNTFGIGLSPVLNIGLSDRFSIDACFASLRYTKEGDTKSFEGIIGANALEFSLVYCFGKRR